MTEEDLQTARRFAEALPAEPFGGPILRVIAEVERLRGLELRARRRAWWGPAARARAGCWARTHLPDGQATS